VPVAVDRVDLLRLGADLENMAVVLEEDGETPKLANAARRWVARAECRQWPPLVSLNIAFTILVRQFCVALSSRSTTR